LSDIISPSNKTTPAIGTLAKPRFSIITPSFRSSAWLPLCLASVADQGISLEHIVQDAGSDDGTLEWLPEDPRALVFVEKDLGMYDAINRGMRRAKGDILAYLNCDEQYLPGALTAVAQFFEQRPDVDVVFGNIVMVDPQGRYLYHRKVQTPLKYHTWTCQLSTLSCGMFFRRQVVFERGFFFESRWRDVGDGEWMIRLLQQGIKMSVLGRFTSAFTCTGKNMSTGENARRERRELLLSAPPWARALKPLFVIHHRLRRWIGGMYSQQPFSYQIFTSASPLRREQYEVPQPKFLPRMEPGDRPKCDRET